MKNSFLLLIVVCYLANERSSRKSLLLKQTGDDLIMKLKWPEIDRVKVASEKPALKWSIWIE